MNSVQMAQLAEAAIETIAKLANVDSAKAELALKTIQAVIVVLKEHHAGKVSSQAALTQIESLHAALEANEEAALAELHARFAK